MKRLLLDALLVLLTASSALAQQIGTGSITGSVTDQQGGVLPGSVVTLTGSDRTLTTTTDQAGRFRFLNLAPGVYKLSIAMQSFTTAIRENIEVRVGATTELPAVAMRVGTLEETVTVSGESPIVDTKATGTATNFTSNELQKIPTSRDPFALMRSVPGVLVDRVNIGGNETGQQSNFSAKGTRPQDATWTLDGVEVTDMAATGASPTYFNYDNFDEIQVSTAGNDIKTRTGGMGLNFVVKRGTNQFHGTVRGYFDNEKMESSNVPDELASTGVTHETSDHNKQISDYGGELGGPIWKDKAWFYASYSIQDVRLVRRAGALIDRTQLKNPNVKVNSQVTKNDNLSFLYFDGFKIKEGRSPGTSNILFDAPTATYHQDNAYTDTPLHGLWKIADDHVFGPKLFVSALYAYYNTGFVLDPIGGLDMQAGRSFVSASSFGSINQSLNVRPQHTANVDARSFLTGFGGSHELKYGLGWRRTDAISGTLWPGNMILAIERSPTDLQAQAFRQGFGGNRVFYWNFYVGDTFSLDRVTIDAGLRYDRQNGRALPSATMANAAFPDVIPGLVFDGYDTPFTWNNWSPRIGVTYALTDDRRTVARASFSRAAGQLNTGTVGVLNTSSTAGSATYRWNDLNGDHFAQADEVDLTQRITAAGGFNPANPTAISSSNVLDPDLKAPVTNAFVAGIERELMPNLGFGVNYSYTRTTDLFGNFSGTITPRVGVTFDDYAPGPGFSGTIPVYDIDYNVPTFIPDSAAITAGGSGFVTTNIPGYYTDYHGLELSLIKRLSNRWMGRVGVSLNNAREHFTDPAGLYDTNGNPTRTVTEPLVDGGQFAPQSGGSGSGTIYINAKWQFNANALYEAPYGIELSANVFGRQGYPLPIVRSGTTAALGSDSTVTVLLTPKIDTLRYPDLWNTDVRVARAFRAGGTSNVRLILDVFNLLNANTALVRVNDVTSTRFNALAQNLSPRIARVGVVVGF
jgi:hypothetical protein